jgi:hypothetical protein
MTINTTTVVGRRTLRFETLNDVLADLDALEGKKLQALGNWSVGQILEHLARTMNGAIDGMKFTAPWYIRLMVGFMRKKFLTGKMPAGFKLPAQAAEQLIPAEPISEAAGFAALRGAIRRSLAETKRAPSPVLGKLTVEEANQLQCRHCELHLSFIVEE